MLCQKREGVAREGLQYGGEQPRAAAIAVHNMLGKGAPTSSAAFPCYNADQTSAACTVDGHVLLLLLPLMLLPFLSQPAGPCVTCLRRVCMTPTAADVSLLLLLLPYHPQTAGRCGICSLRVCLTPEAAGRYVTWLWCFAPTVTCMLLLLLLLFAVQGST
jgi:hypothetical protein